MDEVDTVVAEAVVDLVAVDAAEVQIAADGMIAADGIGKLKV